MGYADDYMSGPMGYGSAGGSGLVARYPFHYSAPPIEAKTSFLWTSMDGVLVGPAVTEHGSPTAGVATPYVTHDGTPVTATRLDGTNALEASLPDPVGDVTYMVMYKPTADLDTNAHYLFASRYTKGIAIHVQFGKVYCTITGDSTVYLASDADYTNAAWNLAIATIDRDGLVYLYTLGAAKSTNAPSGSYSTGMDKIAIGARHTGTAYGLDGDILLAGVIDKCLSATEVEQYQREILGYAAATGPQDSTFTRATAAITESNSKYFMFSKGMPRVIDDGIFIEESARINKCYNNLPSVTGVVTGWTATGGLTPTIVDDAAALLAAGLDPLGDDVLSLVNNSGDTQYIYSGAVSGGVEKHSLSAFARSPAPTTVPKIGWYNAGFTSVGDITQAYARTEYPDLTPPSADEVLGFEIADGETLLVTLGQSELGATVSSPIPNIATVATATRNDDVVTLREGRAQGTFRSLSGGTWTETAASSGTIDLGDEIATETCDTFEVVRR